MAEGDIGAVIDNLKFDAVDCQFPALVHVSGNVFAIAYVGPGNDGWLVTVTINSDGTIENTVEDSYEFDGASCNNPSMIRVSEDIVAIAYAGPDNDGWIKTVGIASNGTITEPFISSYEFDAGLAARPNIVHINGDIFAVIASDAFNDGWARTVEISIDGIISAFILDSLEFATSGGLECKTIKRSDNIYAIVYKNGASDLVVTTVYIADNGYMEATAISSYTFATGTLYEPNIVHVFGDVFAVGFHDLSDDGWIKTITIAENGTITEEVLDTYEFEAVSGRWLDIIHVSGNVFAVSFTDPDGDGRIKSIEIANDGAITEPFISSGEFNTLDAQNGRLLHINGNVCAVAYRGPDDDGWLTTININTVGPSRPHHELIMGLGQ